MVDSVVPAAFQTEKEPEAQWEGVVMDSKSLDLGFVSGAGLQSLFSI